jgi:molybdopterin molybdotransferase
LDGVNMLSVEDARARMLAEIAPLGVEAVALAQAIGRVLAEDVAAIRDQPPFTASAMDGWAMRAADTPGTLAIVGESAAGRGFKGAVEAGQAVRIFTGAAVPPGLDAIVIQEDASREGDALTVPAATPGEWFRPAGGDFRAGQTLLRAGVRIDPWRLSLAAAAGRGEVLVQRRPRVAFLSTGEEIVQGPATPGPYQVFDAGTPALIAMAEGWGVVAERCTPVRDRLEDTIAAIRAADADLIVTIGGASVGDHDLVRAAAEALGASFKVGSIAVRPGKPTFFATLPDGRRLLGLPGNPASCFVCAELFLRPIAAAYQAAEALPNLKPARLAVALGENGGREHWMRATLSADGASVTPYREQDSSLMSVFALSTVLLKRQAGAPAAAAGDEAWVLPLERF